MNTMLHHTTLRPTISLVMSLVFTTACLAQEKSEQPITENANLTGVTDTIVIRAQTEPPEPPVFFSSKALAKVHISIDRVEQTIDLTLQVIQGNATTLSLGIQGDGEIVEVSSEGGELRSWSVRQTDTARFLDLQVRENVTDLQVAVIARSEKLQLPSVVSLLHVIGGESVGFDSIVEIESDITVQFVVTDATGFVPLQTPGETTRFQTSTGGQFSMSINRSGAGPAPVEFADMSLHGELDTNGDSIQFELNATAQVAIPGAEIVVLAGKAAVNEVPQEKNFRLRLGSENGQPVYKLMFPDAGTFPVKISFVAAVPSVQDTARSLDFTVAAGAVVPLTLMGLAENLDFDRNQPFIVPEHRDDSWIGFLPATGHAVLRWSPARQTEEGKLFFTTLGRIEASVGAELLRQDHQLSYRVLQGELKSLQLLLHGPGEILDVSGDHIIGWSIAGEGDQRELNIKLSQAMTGESQINVRSQTPLGAFPVRVEGLRLEPIGAIRYSGLLRLSNSGSVRLEPLDLIGLTQLSPDQFQGAEVVARQVFVYRFPAAEYAFAVSADRVQPEVHISELIVYELSESDRAIHASIEMDIREAPIREWDFKIPPDYSVVSVTGASVADYVAATAIENDRRNLKVIFSQDVSGRQLIVLHLEKSEAAAEADWVLPRIEYPGSKTIRGDIGVRAAAGFRISVANSSQLTEKPLSYFPQPSAGLQQAFRIRQPDWSATMRVELLQRSVQSDVFHLYSLSDETIYGSALINYFVTGSPVSQWRINVPETLGNVTVDGQDVRTWRREGDALIITLNQGVMGASTVLVTFEEKTKANQPSFQAGVITPLDVQSERGYVQVVSPMQFKIESTSVSDELLKLDPLELPAELRLLSTAPALGTWQYTSRPFVLNLNVEWFQPGTMLTQVVEFADADSRVSADGEVVTNVTYFVKSRGQRTLKVKLPEPPVRLWEVSVDGEPVTARQADEFTLIPLPGGADPNVPVEVRLRLGKPSVSESSPQLSLPSVDAPLLKVQWSIVGDENHVLVPGRGTVYPPQPILPPSGLDWTARHGLVSLILIGCFTVIGVWGRGQSNFRQGISLVCLAIAIGISLVTAAAAVGSVRAVLPLELGIPILSAGAPIELTVANIPRWRANISWLGMVTIVLGILCVMWSYVKPNMRKRIRCVGVVLIALGVLWQGDAAGWFFALVALAILLFLFISPALEWVRGLSSGLQNLRWRNFKKAPPPDAPVGVATPVTTTILVFVLMFSGATSSFADVPEGFIAADSIKQEWQVTHLDGRLSASCKIVVTGLPGDRFVLLRAPAVLTQFEGQGLRLTKSDIPGQGLSYVVGIPASDEKSEVSRYQASFEYQLESLAAGQNIPVLTGAAAVAEISFHYDESGWNVQSSSAVRVESVAAEDSTQAVVLLGAGEANIGLTPQTRDVTTEQTEFYVEASNLYLPAPGVVDGRHRLKIRVSQGQVSELLAMIPTGLTVSTVSGPIRSWQFDADGGQLKMVLESPQSGLFEIMIETQRGLASLPADVTLAPLSVADADGEVGFLAIAFGPDAQPEKLTPHGMSVVNLSDFDATLLPNPESVLHRVLRYSDEGGDVVARVAPVAPEVRVTSQQALSLGEERIVMGVNFIADITRTGLFQLSFPLPIGLEVESLSGAALHHWAERSDGDQRNIVLHLNGKTIGTQSFALTLAGASPTDLLEWAVPRFELNEAVRQSGDLIVRPATGIRLRTISRKNVSESDLQDMDRKAQTAGINSGLAYRLLQGDWSLVLGIEQLEPWVTGQLLHDVSLREGQTRTALIASVEVQNASIRSLNVTLPITDEDEIKTLRASGTTVSDLVRTAPDSNVWELQFKRRVIGKIDFRIEYERRGDRDEGTETVIPVGIPQSRQLSYFVAVRAGGRLELQHDELSEGWQRVDWSSIPVALRDAGTRTAPVFSLRSVNANGQLIVHAQRNSLADALKLRVSKGTLTTVLSPTGDQLTAVELTVDVIQRSSLRVKLPPQGELFSIFVNGESVHSIHQRGDASVWQFTILSGIDDRTANVRFVYSVPGDRISNLELVSPELNVPLENIEWSVVAPDGYMLVDHDGNLELVRQVQQSQYDKSSYLSNASSVRIARADQAVELLAKANQLLQDGEQSKASWAFNNVANQHALDAASNEDARVQLENLQTRQAIVGLNTRRQRLYLDNSQNDDSILEDQQLRNAATENPILQQSQLNLQPEQFGQLLRENTTQDNAFLQRVATKLVEHQRTTEPVPQAILISLPTEGAVSTFTRTVQVAENAPLELELEYDWIFRLPTWRSLTLVVIIILMAVGLIAVTAGNSRTTDRN